MTLKEKSALITQVRYYNFNKLKEKNEKEFLLFIGSLDGCDVLCVML